MSAGQNLPGENWLHAFSNAAVRTGIYCGVCLSVVFATWLITANRAPLLERFALERNLACAAALALLAAVPVFRFLRSPGNLLAAGLVGWTILSLSYGTLSLFFRKLSDFYSALHIFVLGAVSYLILATLAWIISCILRVRGTHTTEPHNHMS